MQCSSTKLSAICESATYPCQIMKHELLNCSVCRIYSIVGENISSLCDRFSTRQKSIVVLEERIIKPRKSFFIGSAAVASCSLN